MNPEEASAYSRGEISPAVSESRPGCSGVGTQDYKAQVGRLQGGKVELLEATEPKRGPGSGVMWCCGKAAQPSCNCGVQEPPLSLLWRFTTEAWSGMWGVCAQFLWGGSVRMMGLVETATQM